MKIGGRDLGTVFDRRMAGNHDFVPGQRVDVELTREGQTYQAAVDLVPSGDSVIPLLNLFVVGEEWVLWTPSGYYDASPGGDRLIGWHANRGRDKAAHYYTAHQFRKQFFRPDVIDKILDTGDAARSVELAGRDRARPSPAFDLRKPDDFHKVEPPRVTVEQPTAGRTFRAAPSGSRPRSSPRMAIRWARSRSCSMDDRSPARTSPPCPATPRPSAMSTRTSTSSRAPMRSPSWRPTATPDRAAGPRRS